MRIFISHAAADQPLAKSLVDFLRIAMNLKEDQIFCTSLEGTGVPAGTNFVDYIRKTLQDAVVVIAVLTPQYYESVFCLCELGATWVLEGKDFFPILVPPLSYDDLKAVLVGVQVRKIADKSTYTELRDLLLVKQIASGSSGGFEQKRDEFLKSLPRVLRKLKIPSRVSVAQHSELEDNYKSAIDALEAKNATIDELKEKIEQLKNCKDPTEVAVVLKPKVGSERDEFNDLLFDFRQLNLSRVVKETLFHEQRGEPHVPPHGFGMEDLWESIERADQYGLVQIHQDRITSANHPKITKANRILNAIEELLSEERCAVLISELEDEYEFPISLENRQFWEEFLKL